MSGVLDRMAKRALGTLPSIQPITSPHYARQHAPLGGGVLDSLPALDARFATEAPALAAQADTSERSTEHSGTSSSLRPSKSGPPLRDAETEIAGRRALQEDETRMRLAESPRPAGVPEESDAVPPGTVLPDLAASEAASGMATLRTPRREGEQDAWRQELTSSIEVVGAPVRIKRSRGPARSSGAETEAGRGGDSKTEVHISIGSIELRAPRAEARPPVAPFRPRVSLSDFLRRKPEAGA